MKLKTSSHHRNVTCLDKGKRTPQTARPLPLSVILGRWQQRTTDAAAAGRHSVNSVSVQSIALVALVGFRRERCPVACPVPSCVPCGLWVAMASVVRNYSLGPVAACVFMVGFLFQQALTILYLITSPPLWLTQGLAQVLPPLVSA